MRFSADVFAVEDTTVQLTWRGAPAGPVAITVRDERSTRTLEVVGESGPGALIVDELEADTEYRISIAPKGTDPSRPRKIRTLPTLPGAELTRLSTISDIHIGESGFGVFPRSAEVPEPAVPHTLRCALAAIDEWTQWGSQHVVFKGDLVDHGTRAEWETLAKLLARVPQPWTLILGNHETMNRAREKAEDMLAELGLPADPVRTTDLPGLRIVHVETAVDNRGHGRVRDVAAAADAVGESDLPCLVVIHHHIQRLPLPMFWPPGIESKSGKQFVRELRRANPRIMLISGHSHRHRKHLVDGIPLVEVGSVKDYPGVWAGYVVHESGVRQVARRVSPLDCLQWTDKTRSVMLGAWQFFSPGSLAARCFVHRWV